MTAISKDLDFIEKELRSLEVFLMFFKHNVFSQEFFNIAESKVGKISYDNNQTF